MRNTKIIALAILSLFFTTHFDKATAQVPTASPTPADQRGLGIQSSGTTSSTQSQQQGKEAKPELVLQTGYNNLIGATRMVFSPDGRLLATASFHNNAIKLWETATSRKLRELSTGTGSSISMAPVIAFSRDNRYIAAAGGDNTTTVWEVLTGREVATLAGPQGSVMASFGIYFMAFTPDNRLVTVSDAVRVWDLASGRELRTVDLSDPSLSGFSGTDGGMALTPDGQQLALRSGQDDEIRFIDLITAKETRKVKLPENEIESLQLGFNSSGNFLVAGVVNKRLKLWNLTTKDSKDLVTTTKDFSQIKLSPDGRLVSFSENYLVRIWETSSAREVGQLKVPNSGAFTMLWDAFSAFSDDGKKIVTGGFDTDTIIWETESQKPLTKMAGRANLAYDVSFSADGTELLTGARTRWDLRTGRGLRVTQFPLDKTYPQLSPNGRLIAVRRFNDPVATIVEVATGRQLFKLTPSGDEGQIDNLRFNRDSTMLVATYGPRTDLVMKGGQTGLHRNSVKIWDLKNGTELRTLATDDVPASADFSNDGRVLTTIGSFGGIALWDVQSGNKLRDLTSSPMKGLTGMTPQTLPQQTGRMPKNMPKNMPNIQMPNMAELADMMTNMIGTLAAGTSGTNKASSIAFSPDNAVIASGGIESKSNIDIAAMMTGAAKPKKGSRQQDPADLMKDLKVEAVGRVQLWDAASGQEIGQLKGHGKAVTKVAFSRDGKLLATAGNDNTLKLWDMTSKRELRTLTGHTANINSIDISPDNRLLASSSEDGATFLWDTNSGEHLLTLISLDDGAEWLVVTPQGLFDGTPVTWNQILWRYNQETFNVAPIEWFFNEFYYPGLLADIYFGKRPKVAQDISKKDRRQPIVKLTAVGETPESGVATRTLKLKIDITDAPADKENPQGSGARDVRLFRNGSLVKVWRGDVLNGKPSVTLEHDLTVTAGPNRLVAYAFNKDNVKSKDAPLVFGGAPSLKRKGVAYIIAVGVNEYENKQYNLKYAVADAESFGNEVRSRQTQIGDFERVEVITLLNENATKANILEALKRLGGNQGAPSLKASPMDSLKRVEPEDTVIIYYAGHGTAQAARFYLIPHDLGYTGERTKLTEQGLSTILAHSISDVELEQAVEGLEAGHLLLIIDACNSGQALEAEEKRRGPMNSKGLAQLAYEKGMYILTAAQSFQAALEAAQLGHGLLTYTLIEEGLKTPVADVGPKDGMLLAREWLDFATERVPQMQEQKMIEGRGVGLAIAFTEGEATVAEPQKRTVQRPRVFYRREMEANPLVIAKP
jgi:WD40 repeat protein